MSQEEDFIPTRGSKKTTSKHSYESVTYRSYKSKKPRAKLETEEPSKTEPTANELNMKRAKFEVMKFGMSGFNPAKKEEAKVQLAIKLGAKPRRNKCKNYKVLIKERQAEKKREKSRLEFQQLGKNSLGKSNAKGKSYDRKRRKDGILDIYGTVKTAIKTGNPKMLKRRK